MGPIFPFLAASLPSLFLLAPLEITLTSPLSTVFSRTLSSDRVGGVADGEMKDQTLAQGWEYYQHSPFSLMRTQQPPGATINIDRGPCPCPVTSQGCKSLMLSGHPSPWRTDWLLYGHLHFGGESKWTRFRLSPFPAIIFMTQLSLLLFYCCTDRDRCWLLLPHTHPHQTGGSCLSQLENK